MAEADTVMPPPAPEASFDPVTAMAQARDQLLTEARETWDSIQAMAAGPERARMEAAFSRTSTELMAATQADPFFRDHATVAEAGDDLFANLNLSALQHVRTQLAIDDPRAVQIEGLLEELRDALTARISEDPELTAQMGTTAEEVAEYMLQGEHSAAQAEKWHGRSERLDEETSARLAAVLKDGHRTVDDAAVPRDLTEQVALDQLLTVDRHQQLADVPGVEALVDRMIEELPAEDLEVVRGGDSRPLQAEIRDPAVRAAVAAELKTEADLEAGHAPSERETVEAYQIMARARQAELTAEHGTNHAAEIEDGHTL